MADKPKFNLKEFERRERDILNRHRMPLDVKTDIQELTQVQDLPRAMPDTGMMPDNQTPQGY